MNEYKLRSLISLYQDNDLNAFMEISDVVYKDKLTHLANKRVLAPETLSSLARLSDSRELDTRHLLPKEVIYISFKTDVEIIAFKERHIGNFKLQDV